MRNYESFAEFIQLRCQPIGRMIFAVNGVRMEALAHNDTELLALCDEFHIYARETRLLIMRYNGEQQNGSPGSRIVEVDNEADRITGIFFRNLVDFRDNYSATHPLGKLAREVLNRVFPLGLKAVVHQPSIEQLDALEAIIELIQNQYNGHILELGQTTWFNRLVDITRHYREELETLPQQRIVYSQVRNALRECHERLLQIIARVLGTYNCRTLEHAAIRRAFLEPIMIQDAVVEEFNRRQRQVIDVDPMTGLESEEESEVIEETLPASCL